MRWWHLSQVHTLEQRLFPTDAWSLGLWWAELARVGRDRSYAVALAGEPAEPAEQVIGYAGLAVAGSTADIQTLGVHPDWQGQGVGATLLRHLLATAADQGCEAVMLEVRADNLPAIRLYHRHGFSTLRTRPGYYDAGRVDALILRLLLAASPLYLSY